VPAHLYSFSFERRTDWSRKYAGQAEILGHIEELVRKHDLRPHLRLGTELAGARFDAARGVWRLRTVQGEAIAACRAIRISF
jgi:cation diffusion facilitator CzcD-associated flavoprotein CzcO